MPIHENAKKTFENFPILAVWRLLIDSNRQDEKGPKGFDEKEPGYLENMQAGLNFVLESIGEPLSAKYIQVLHDKCVKYTKVLEPDNTLSSFKSGYRVAVSEFSLISRGKNKNFTEKGLTEFLAKSKQDDYYCVAMSNIEQPTTKLTSENNTYDNIISLIEAGNSLVISIGNLNRKSPQQRKEELQNHLDKIVKQYEQDIKKAKNDEQKITAIVTCIHELEILHPFEDANCRTICVLLLTKLLIEQGLKPTIVKNPNRFDAFAVSELCDEVMLGMSKFTMYTTGEETDKDKGVIYLKDNHALCYFAANEILADMAEMIPIWQKINQTDKDKVQTMIKEALATANLGEVDTQKFNEIKQKLIDVISKACYVKKNSMMCGMWEYDSHAISFSKENLGKPCITLEKLIATIAPPAEANSDEQANLLSITMNNI